MLPLNQVSRGDTVTLNAVLCHTEGGRLHDGGVGTHPLKSSLGSDVVGVHPHSQLQPCLPLLCQLVVGAVQHSVYPPTYAHTSYSLTTSILSRIRLIAHLLGHPALLLGYLR